MGHVFWPGRPRRPWMPKMGHLCPIVLAPLRKGVSEQYLSACKNTATWVPGSFTSNYENVVTY